MSTDDNYNEEMIDYLSLAWIRELSREVRESAELADLATRHSIGVTQIVEDAPEGDVTYHLQVADGTAAFGAGPADPEDVKMQQSYETAVAVAAGELNAQEAFVTGKILLFGDREALMGAPRGIRRTRCSVQHGAGTHSLPRVRPRLVFPHANSLASRTRRLRRTCVVPRRSQPSHAYRRDVF